MNRLAPLLCLVLLGCEDGPAPPSLVDSVRVLAIVAEQPEARPGVDVTVRAEIANPHGQAFVARWHACAAEERNVSEAILQYGGRVPNGGCPQDAPLRVELDSDGPEVTLPGRVTADALSLARELDPRVDGLVATVGLPFVVQLTLEDPETGEPLVLAYKRVALTTRDTPSTNPPPPTFSFGGEAVVADGEDCGIRTVAADTEVELLPTANEAWFETHPRFELDGTIGEARETAYYSWFATAGEIETPITVAPDRLNRWRAPAAPGEVQLWLVVRDGHLGASFCRLRARVE